MGSWWRSMKGWKLSLVCSVVICYVVSGSQTAGVNRCAPDMPCNNFQCIKRDQWCDREVDCADESDEKYCKTKKWFLSEIPDNKCDGRRHFLCSNLKCVPIEVKCDEFNDCGDYSDEEHCVNSCAPDMPCNNFQCIKRDQWCDGYVDCDDESDEEYCKTKKWYLSKIPDNKCDERRHFVCSNQKCVPIEVKCDGFNDCEDYSDEELCEYPDEDEKSDSFTTNRGDFNAHDISRNGNLPDSSGDSTTATTAEPDWIHYTSAATESYARQGPRVHSIDHYDARLKEPQNLTPPPPTDQDLTWEPPVPTTPWNAPVATRSFPNRQQWPENGQRQRAVVHGQAQNPGSSSVSSNRKDPLTLFDFREDYRRKIQEAAELLLGQSTSFPLDVMYEVMKYDEMKRRLKFDLGMKLFSSLHEPSNEEVHVCSLAGIPNDSEADKEEWTLYRDKDFGIILPAKGYFAKQNQGVNRIFPNTGERFAFHCKRSFG